MRRPSLRSASPTLAVVCLAIVLGACAAASPTLDSVVSPMPTPGPPASIASPSRVSTPVPSPAAAEARWERLGDMSEPRWAFTALELLDGRVFVIDQELCLGISDLGGSSGPPGRTDILDLETGQWAPAAPLNKARSRFVAARLPDGRVLVTGGSNFLWGSYSSTKLFDADTGKWMDADLLDTARQGLVGLGLPDGRVLVAGGVYSEGYRSEDDFWAGNAPEERWLDSAEVYDPASGRWSKSGRLEDPAAAGTAYLLPDGRVLVVGDIQDGESYPANVYDPVTGRWADAGGVEQPMASASIVLGDGSLLVIGGSVEVPVGQDAFEQQPTAKVVRYDPDTGRSTEIAPLPAPRADAVAVRLADGRVLVAGGSGTEMLPGGMSAAATDTTFLYDPERDAWAETAAMPFADLPGQALLLSDGSVLVIGGDVPEPRPDTDSCEPAQPVGWTARYVPGQEAGG